VSGTLTADQAATEVAGRWYVNMEDSTGFIFAGACACA